MMGADTLLFFEGHMDALTLYEKLEERILSEINNVRIKAQKSQISFYNRHLFACVSFLQYKVESSRIDIAAEPYPNRWTHHVLVSRPDEIDEELMGWIKEAAEFAYQK